MIDKIVIKNFQSHKLTKLEFHPGVNCIIGSSDVGKTAILRSIRWVAWNRPQGEAFQSWWGGETCVSLWTNGHQIDRSKYKSTNAYILDEGEPLSAIKTEVPEQILQALNFDEVNLQRQFDRPFLLDSSPNVVAQHFNRLSRLDDIDIGTRNVQSWIRKIEQDINADQGQLNELQKQLEQFINLEELDGWMSQLEGMDRQRLSAIAANRKLDQIICEIKSADTEILNQERLTKHGPDVDKIINLFSQRKTILGQSETLGQVILQANRIQEQIAQLESTSTHEISVLEILSLYDRRKSLTNLVDQLYSIMTDLRQVVLSIDSAKEGLIKLESRFKQEFPDICPLCGKDKLTPTTTTTI